MKDFADLYILASDFEFNYEVLRLAVTRTFERRRTSVPTECPFCFTDSFANLSEKQIQWSAFLRKNELNNLPQDFPTVIHRIAELLLPVLLPGKNSFSVWHPDEQWQ